MDILEDFAFFFSGESVSLNLVRKLERGRKGNNNSYNNDDKTNKQQLQHELYEQRKRKSYLNPIRLVIMYIICSITMAT